MSTTRITNSPASSAIGTIYKFFVNDNGALKQVDKDIVKNYFNQTWSTLTGKPFVTLDTDVFTVENDELTIPHDHIHTNQTNILDKFTLDTDDNLLFNGEEIGGNSDFYVLPQATETALGGIKAKTKTTESVEVAIDTTTGKLYIPATSGVDFSDIQDMLVSGNLMNIVADTTNETLAFNVNGKTIMTYANNTAYATDDIVIYSTNLYSRITAGADTEWTVDNWRCLSSGTDGINAYIHIKYAASQPTQNSDMSDVPNAWIGILSDNAETASTMYSDYEWFKIKGETGEAGKGILHIRKTSGADLIDTYTITYTDNTTETFNITNGRNGTDGEDGLDGDDGFSPTISEDVTNTADIYKLVITNKNGFITTPNLKGEIIERTEISTTKEDLTCTLLATGWSSSIPYTQTVSVAGITAELNPRIEVVISDNVVTGRKEERDYSYITKATTADGSITAYCYNNKPEVDLNIMIEVV